MPLSIAVQKDIGEYTEKLVFGLSGRQLSALGIGLGAVLAEAVVGCAVLGYELESLFVPMCLTLTAAFLLGFVKPFGLKFSLAARLYLSQWLGTTKVIYKSSVYKRAHNAGGEVKRNVEAKYYRRACKKSGCPEVDIPRLASGEFTRQLRRNPAGASAQVRLRTAGDQARDARKAPRDARRVRKG